MNQIISPFCSRIASARPLMLASAALPRILPHPDYTGRREATHVATVQFGKPDYFLFVQNDLRLDLDVQGTEGII